MTPAFPDPFFPLAPCLCVRTRYRKRPPGVRDAFSEAFGAQKGLLGYATRFLRHWVPERASYGTEYAFGAQNGFLWYATHFQKLAVLKTGFSGTGEIFGTENALLRYGMNRTRLLRSVFWLEDAAITNNPAHPNPIKWVRGIRNAHSVPKPKTPSHGTRCVFATHPNPINSPNHAKTHQPHQTPQTHKNHPAP